MKKINLRGLQEVLSEKELKNVLGGSVLYPPDVPTNLECYVYYCAWSGMDIVRCYKEFNACLDEFGDTCPEGGYFDGCR